MNKLTRTLATAGAAAALAIGGLTATAPAAHAGTCTKAGPITLCGKVSLLKGSARSLKVGNNWNGSCVGTIKYIRPGETSSRFFKDTDCFEVPSGYHAHVGTTSYNAGKDVKVRDGQHFKVTLHRGSKA